MMIYWINKIAGWLASPMGLEVLLLAAGLICLLLPKRRIRLAIGFLVAALALFWVLGSTVTVRALEWELEREFPVRLAEEMPAADAIVLLGGGMAAAPGHYPYADMAPAADRVWHAARLYKAGKAPIIIPSGSGDLASTVPLLQDFGVPSSAILVEGKARNTEENARFVEKILAARGKKRADGEGNLSRVEGGEGRGSGDLNRVERGERIEGGGSGDLSRVERVDRADGKAVAVHRPKILLVTSAWHMRRSVLMYERYAPNLEVIPAATDYEMAARQRGDAVVYFLRELVPDADAFFRSSFLLKEYVGYWGYRLLRR